MKLRPVAKLDKRNKMSKKFFMLPNCDVIVIFPIYGQSGVIWKADSKHMVCKTYIFNNSNLLSCKNSKQN